MSISATTARPTVVTAAFWLWIASAAIGLIGFAVSFPSVVAATQSLSGPMAGGAMVGSVAGAIIGAAIRVVFAIFLLRGANWARIVLTVLGAIIVLSLLVSIITGNVLAILELLAVVAAVVLQWLSSAKPFFRRA
ncbi:hypothetical protein P5G50_06885 [Leifsonia sp. F6_8S_P_1B]|uniref:Uncharacterized protein n=1 Tax=Leifsonia williamsii TaxID=3035919 RepID=A0ABT8KBJ7_9MICO|nr:hypothetical protein [Leifsonia williamsii]MDN4614176.1 hypothetical protein [Leifsonia williamsii]